MPANADAMKVHQQRLQKQSGIVWACMQEKTGMKCIIARWALHVYFLRKQPSLKKSHR
jgi:hypothetical protein